MCIHSEKYWPANVKRILGEKEAEEIMKKHQQRRRSSVVSFVSGFVQKGFRKTSTSSFGSTINEADEQDEDKENGMLYKRILLMEIIIIMIENIKM